MEEKRFEDLFDDFIEVKRRSITSERSFVDKNTGEVDTITKEIQQFDRIDVGKFFKIFHKSEEAYMKLSLPGYRLLGYVSYRLKEGQHQISLDVEDVMRVCGWKSKKMFYIALSNLMDNEFLLANDGKKNVYDVNVKYFFNGMRTKLVKYTFSKPTIVNGSKVKKVMYAEIEEPEDE